jgi:hypothetical protein
VVSLRPRWPLFLTAEKPLTAKFAKKSREGRKENLLQPLNQQSAINNRF